MTEAEEADVYGDDDQLYCHCLSYLACLPSETELTLPGRRKVQTKAIEFCMFSKGGTPSSVGTF